MLEQSEQLIEVLAPKSPAEVASLMHISEDLAALNVQRYLDFATPFTAGNARPALLTFDGDVYRGLAAAQRFGARDYTEAQKTLRILSGLYGLLRPLDLMQPYRLEMGTRLQTPKGRSLYDFWGDTITALLAADLVDSPGAPVLVNLASDEYFSAVRPAMLNARVVAPRFEDEGADGRYRVVSFFAKRARGEMAAWLVRRRVRSVAALRGFDGAGYAYCEEASSPDRPVYRRPRR